MRAGCFLLHETSPSTPLPCELTVDVEHARADEETDACGVSLYCCLLGIKLQCWPTIVTGTLQEYAWTIGRSKLPRAWRLGGHSSKLLAHLDDDLAEGEVVRHHENARLSGDGGLRWKWA